MPVTNASAAPGADVELDADLEQQEDDPDIRERLQLM
jgi:hypothetical protein